MFALLVCSLIGGHVIPAVCGRRRRFFAAVAAVVV